MPAVRSDFIFSNACRPHSYRHPRAPQRRGNAGWLGRSFGRRCFQVASSYEPDIRQSTNGPVCRLDLCPAPEVHPELMGPPRRLVVKVSGLSRKLVQDPRFLKEDAQLLHEIEQNLVETLNLNHSEADRLCHLILKIDLKKPENTSESDRKEIRKLLRQAVHDR